MAQSIGLSEVRLDGDDIYWLESRPQEGGRSVVVRYVAWNSSSEDVTPEGFNVRTRVHEYGGGAWTVADGMIYFSNHADNRLYRMDRYGHQPMPLTPEGSWRYADGLVDSRRRSWIGVREDHSAEGQPVNTIVRIDIDGSLQRRERFSRPATISIPRPGFRPTAAGSRFSPGTIRTCPGWAPGSMFSR